MIAQLRIGVDGEESDVFCQLFVVVSIVSVTSS